MDSSAEARFKSALRSLKIVLISTPGLRRDTLVAMLRSIPGNQNVYFGDTLVDCELAIPRHEASFVVIDHSLSEGQLEYALPRIREKSPKAWILMLVGHPRDTFAFTSCRPDSILCEGFSSASLMQEIEKAYQFQLRAEGQV